MISRLASAFAVVLLGAFATGCTPDIGDSCTISTDCSQLGDRLCDTTQPDGYCTIFNCEPDTCPDSVCVGFADAIDPLCGPTVGEWARFERTFCMKACDSDGDCRSGYTCVDPTTRSAKIVDQDPLSSKACMVTTIDPTLSDDAGAPAVCFDGDGGTLPPPYMTTTSSAGGAGGTGGTGGAGGAGGAGGHGGMGGTGG